MIQVTKIPNKVSCTHPVDLPVTVSVMVLSKLGGLINSLRTLDSTANGKPLSSISSRSYKEKKKTSNVQEQFKELKVENINLYNITKEKHVCFWLLPHYITVVEKFTIY